MVFPSNRSLMGFSVVALMAIAFVSVLYVTMPPANKDLVLVLAGAIASRFGTVVDYFFGSKAHDGLAGPGV